MESQSLYSEEPTTPTQPKASVVEDFVDIFYAPSQVFERRRDGRFGLALLLLIVLLVVLLIVTKSAMSPVYDAMSDLQMRAVLKQNPDMPAAALERSRGFMAKFLMPGVVFGATVAILLGGVTLWFAGKLFDAKQTISQALMVATYANVPRVVAGTLASAVQAYFLTDGTVATPFAVSLGPARFLDAEAALKWGGILARLDLFTIWTTVLLGIGLAVTGKIDRKKALAAAFVVWLLATAIAGIGALRM